MDAHAFTSSSMADPCSARLNPQLTKWRECALDPLHQLSPRMGNGKFFVQAPTNQQFRLFYLYKPFAKRRNLAIRNLCRRNGRRLCMIRYVDKIIWYNSLNLTRLCLQIVSKRHLVFGFVNVAERRKDMCRPNPNLEVWMLLIAAAVRTKRDPRITWRVYRAARVLGDMGIHRRLQPLRQKWHEVITEYREFWLDSRPNRCH